jgi:hypothetical protein
MRVGRPVGGILLALGMAGCDLIVPIPEYRYAELEDAPGIPDAFDATAIESDAAAEDGAALVAPVDAGEGGSPNPCPSPNYACCGYTHDAGPGRLRCSGMGCANPGTCDVCLELDCNPDEGFCCAPGGDTPPSCRPWDQSCELGP